MRLLIVKTSSMGDVVHACAAVSDAARWRPDLQIDWLVEAPFAPIPAMHRAVRRVIPMSWRRWRKQLLQGETRRAIQALSADLRQQHYDLVIDLQGLVKSAWWARRAGAPVAGYDGASAREPLAAWLYQRRAAVPAQMQAVQRCRELLAAHLGYPCPDTAPDFGLVAPPAVWRPDAPNYAVLVPVASRVEKRWPQADWRAVIDALAARGCPSVLMWGSKDEEALVRDLAQGTPALVPPFLAIRDAAAVLACAEVVVGLDTGLAHLGAALGRPTVGIYCDHEPGLAGITGAAAVRSLGGKGRPPTRADVLDAVHAVLG